MPKNDRNSARNNGKRWKQKPGVSEKSCPGKTKGGYTPAALERRAIKRAATKTTR